MYHQTPRVKFVSKVGSSGKFNNILIQSVMSMNPRIACMLLETLDTTMTPGTVPGTR